MAHQSLDSVANRKRALGAVGSNICESAAWLSTHAVHRYSLVIPSRIGLATDPMVGQVHRYQAVDQFGRSSMSWPRQARPGGHASAPAYPRILDELLPAAHHVIEQYANNPVEADQGRLTSRLRPMRGLKRLRSARVISTGHAFVGEPSPRPLQLAQRRGPHPEHVAVAVLVRTRRRHRSHRSPHRLAAAFTGSRSPSEPRTHRGVWPGTDLGLLVSTHRGCAAPCWRRPNIRPTAHQILAIDCQHSTPQ